MQTIVIKIGGSTLGSHDTTLEDLVTLQQGNIAPVVVHGGGKVSTEWLKRMDLPTQFLNGLRVTDNQTLEVVVAALAGLVNKQLVASLQALGARAIGISGVDGETLQARVKDPELGHVGEIVSVRSEALRVIIDSGFLPVIAPISFESPAVSKEASFLLNVNADTAAGEIAAALKADKLIFLTDVEGIRDQEGNLLSHLSRAAATELLTSGVAFGGMIPKVEACLRALDEVPMTRIIDGSQPHALLGEMEGKGGGTTIA